jgi:hypothetical protein
MISNECIPEISLEELRDFVELQCDDSIIELDSDNNHVNYMRSHLRIVHNLILNEISIDEATRQLGRLEL